MDILFRVELYVKDIEKALNFYQEIIGLELFGKKVKEEDVLIIIIFLYCLRLNQSH